MDMDQSNFKRMERESMIEVPSLSQEQIEKDLKNIYDNQINIYNKHRIEYADETVNLTYGPKLHQMLIEVGHQLIDYNGIDNATHFYELIQKFIRLGRNVAFITQEYQDRGLIAEECVWFGKFNQVPREAGLQFFHPSTYLRGKAPIQDCEPEELIRLVTDYREGQIEYFAESLGYGSAFKK